MTAVCGIADPFSALTHLVGALAFLILGIGLIDRARGERLRLTAVSIYVTGVVFALLASGTFHSLPRDTTARALFLVVDHAAIFFLIAATYTPIQVIQFSGLMRWGMLSVVWTAALSGILLKAFFIAAIPEWISLSLYLGLGWIGLITAVAVYRAVGLKPLTPLIVGALAYTLGAVLEFAKVPNWAPGVVGPHEIFHLLVLTGVASHWMYIRRITMYAHVMDVYQSPASADRSYG